MKTNLGAPEFQATARTRIAAIQTRWRGWYFRSRAEARWAVLFDALRIGFQYEPEGFVLADGTRYLPDFFLPRIKTWAEVKGLPPTDEEQHKAEQLVMGTGGLCLYLIKQPDFCLYHGISLDAGELSEARYLLDIDYHGRRFYDGQGRLFSDPGADFCDEEDFTEQYRDAVYLSRAERFDGRSLPKPGYEPFNLSDREMGGNW